MIANGEEKPSVLAVEDHMDKLDDGVVVPGADYAGATAKTDPLEIALVRKLDLRIMPPLWAMYFLNYVRNHFSVS